MSDYDQVNVHHVTDAVVIRKGSVQEEVQTKGRFIAKCFDVDGNLKWEDTIDNVVTNVGKDLALDTTFSGSGYTVVGPYMGLISSVNYTSGPAVSDTMASHTGWTEAGNANAPTYTAPRPTCVWSAASNGSKQLSAGLVFSMTATGTVKGSFIVFGTGALSTIDDINGILWSSGLFSGGDKPVGSGDTVTVSYTVAM